MVFPRNGYYFDQNIIAQTIFLKLSVHNYILAFQIPVFLFGILFSHAGCNSFIGNFRIHDMGPVAMSQTQTPCKIQKIVDARDDFCSAVLLLSSGTLFLSRLEQASVKRKKVCM